jgi:hypothetical protein
MLEGYQALGGLPIQVNTDLNQGLSYRLIKISL